MSDSQVHLVLERIALCLYPPQSEASLKKSPPNPSTADFHGPYNKLLYTLFPADTSFTVVPQYLPESRDSADFIDMFAVTLDNKTVFMLHLMRPKDIVFPSRREVADRQMRELVADVIDCPLPTLHAVSAMGTKLCFYSQPQDGLLTPRFILPDLELLVDVAPKARWDCDILEDDGAQRLQAVVEEIKQGCANLWST
ncbi:hypothetical protein EDD16DRAFT_1831821 [Pisolithus croceorrhizus]|nr:hypothetical protein EDD16DRAFT_1831821 [Pisolithus croceorrhizus]KAI6119515.1 hypothetical protein EV401DRAFT_2263910 [Pisolithus croceorrhizus]KAI6164367.1 hypothetical protein EDD17DRAFT_1872564 [Pisolithus thermaeus]